MKHDNKLEDKIIIAAKVMLKQTTFKGVMFIENKDKPTNYRCLMKEANDDIALSRMKRNEYPIHVQHKMMMIKNIVQDQSVWWRSNSCDGHDKCTSIEIWNTSILH